MSKDQYLQLLFLLIILLPFAMMTWRSTTKWRIFKHLLAWGGIILFLYVVGKTFEGSKPPQEVPADLRENGSVRTEPL